MPLSAGDKRKKQILVATLEVIAEQGVDAVTHRSVGRQCDLSNGVVSYHFPTRDSLIYKSFEYYFGSFEDMMAKVGWKSDEKMTVRRIIDVLTKVTVLEMDNANSTLVEHELILVAARKPELAALYRKWEKHGLDIFAAGLKQSGFKKPMRIAKIIVNIIRG
ncbi:MAG: TetR family transcriptional regulator, partial [Emcibacteraceae bacterium]|nr:TetR family transcriptional regulator [Emcibacteraceae bacterium]